MAESVAPSLGRIVIFYGPDLRGSVYDQAAIVCGELEESRVLLIHLAVFDEFGCQRPEQSVPHSSEIDPNKRPEKSWRWPERK